MRKIIFLVAVSFSVPTFAQQNTQGANTESSDREEARGARGTIR